MADTGQITFFKIDDCGLYKVGGEDIFGCEPAETFKLIHDWVKDKALTDTIPWHPSEARKNVSNCYCKDIYKHPGTGDYLLVLWKSEAAGNGSIFGVAETDTTGAGEVVEYTAEYKGKKVIWGRPCYYWVIPEFDAVLSIKFDHSVSDALMFETYVRCCINNRVNHHKKVKDKTPKGHVRICFEDNPSERFSFRFGVSLKTLNTASSELQKLAAKVTHIIRRETIKIKTAKDERAEWVKWFTDKVPYVRPKFKSNSRKIEVVAEASPTAEELRQIIEQNLKPDRKPSDWDNVGFQHDGVIVWVDKYRLRDEISVHLTANPIFKAKDLYDYLRPARKRILKPLRDEKPDAQAEEAAES